MSIKTETPGQLTAAKQVNDRVITNVSTPDGITVSEIQGRKVKQGRKDNPDSWGNKTFIDREAACRPDTEDLIRGLPGVV